MSQKHPGSKWYVKGWMKPYKRLAFYARDNYACLYCGYALEEGAQLTLDHLIPKCQGGSNKEENIITACHKCNSVRGSREWKKFAKDVEVYLNGGTTARAIIAKIKKAVTLPLDVPAAKAIIARRKLENVDMSDVEETQETV